MPYCVQGRTNPVRRCRICGEPILFIRTTAGKPMPVNAEPDYYIPSPAGDRAYVTDTGEVVWGFLAGDAAEDAVKGYTSHFANCPGAADMRRS